MDTKKIKVPKGIPGVNLTEIEREVPSTEPDGWPINEKLKHVGKNTTRTDAILKVTGQATYTSDVKLPGMQYAAILHSPHPAAKINTVDITKARNFPGVSAVHVLEISKSHAAKPKNADDVGYPEIKYAGQPIAGVAAENMQIAEKALKLIEISYNLQPFVIDLHEAREPNAPLVFEQQVEQSETGGGGGGEEGLPQKGNVRGPSTGSFLGGNTGDVEKGFAESDIIVEGIFKTQVQTHSALETHGCVVDFKPDMLTVYASTQSTKSVRDEFASVFDMPVSKVRCICKFMGGGFGAKYGAGNFGVIAGHLSKKSGKPVKAMLSRKAEHLCVGNRPNSYNEIKIGAKSDGTLMALQQESYGTAGVGLGAGVGRIAKGLYPIPNFKQEQYDVFTNAGPGAAFRAPGNPQGAFALEQLIDEIAEKLNMDPLKYRDIIDPNEVRKEERKVAAEKFNWSRRKPKNSDNSRIKKGMGVAQSTWPKIIDIDSTAEVRLMKDGTVEVRSAVQDIGTGTRTILAQVVAEELAINPEEVGVHIGDTYFPNGPPSGGSQVTCSITPAARNAAYKAKMELFEQVAKKWEIPKSEIRLEDGQVKADGKSMSLKKALSDMRTDHIIVTASREDEYGGFKVGKSIGKSDLGSVQMAEVSVDTETGFVKVDKIVAVHSCGRPINPKQIQSQVNGGVIQGIGYALYENRVMDKKTGHMVNPNMDQYKMPFSMEIPEIEVYNIEEYSAMSSTDAYGIAEPANIATAVAIANAIYNAIGKRIYELPVTPQRILNALETNA